MSQSTSKQNGVPLSGLDGSNPLAFLAAVGVLATLDRMGTAPRMAWTLDSGSWRPHVYAEVDSPEGLIARLAEGLSASEAATAQVWGANTRLPYSAPDFRELGHRLATEAHMSERLAADLVAALGVDALADKEGNFADTSLRMVRSADSGGKGLCAYAAWIIQNATIKHLQQIFDSHASELDEGTSLRWDPAELRTRALQWGDPSKEAVRSRRGLNRFALEAVPLFTTVPFGPRAMTVGFSRVRGRQGLAFTWPIWTVPVSCNIVRSLLTFDALCEASPNSRELAARGITVVFRSMRFPSSKYYSNFTPAMAV